MHCGLAINCCSLDYWRCRANASKSSERLLDLTTRIVLHPRATRLLTLQLQFSSSSSSSSFKQQLIRFASVSAMHAWSGLSLSLPCVYHPCFTVGLGVRPDQIGRTSLPRYVFPTRPVGPVRTTTADRVELLTSDQTGHQANQPHNNTPLTSRLHVTREDTPNQISSSRSFASFCMVQSAD